MSKLLTYFNGDEMASSTWQNKYAVPGEETPDDMHKRMAKEFAKIEAQYTKDELVLSENDIYELFKDFKYIIPGGSVMASLGTNKLTSLSNCFVIDRPADSYSSIMNTKRDQANLMKRRGGVGTDLSYLRPRGSAVNNSANYSTGAASFMEGFSQTTTEVAQGGRRGALMLSMHINHPDIQEFIEAKQDLTKITGANISVQVTDEFMKAVREDKDYILTYPIDFKLSENVNVSKLEYDKLISINSQEKHYGYIKRVKAKELWNKLMQCAHNTAEPGILFIDRIHNYSPDGVYPNFKAIGTNPCGEIPMGKYDSCRLIHINFTSFVKNPFSSDCYFDYEELLTKAQYAMKLSDDLVDLELKAIKQIMDKCKDDPDECQLWLKIYNTTDLGRRAGLGFTGLSDVIAMLGLKLGSSEALKVIEDIMYHFMKGQLIQQVSMAKTRGCFKAWSLSLEEGNKFDSITNPWKAHLIEKYPNLYTEMLKYGRRNISFSTVAPTGTVSLMTRSSSGIEPVFAPFYFRKRKCVNSEDRVDFIDKVGEKFTKFSVLHPNFEKWLVYKGVENPSTLSKDELEVLFKQSPWYGSISSELDYLSRIKIQQIVQNYTSHAISSTLNLPNNVSLEDVSNIYMKAWESGLKGVTIYRDGSRDGILTTNKVNKQQFTEESAIKRPRILPANLYQRKIKGASYIVIIGLMENKPYEIFCQEVKNNMDYSIYETGHIIKVKKGIYQYITKKNEETIIIPLEENTVEERAHALLISMLLRHRAPIEEVIKVARKVDDNISSFTSAICRVLYKYIIKSESKGEVCPDCGHKLQHEAGCVKCNNCSYSVCLIAIKHT